ncbi:hypothetical protein [Psychroserpens sp.]
MATNTMKIAIIDAAAFSLFITDNLVPNINKTLKSAESHITLN